MKDPKLRIENLEKQMAIYRTRYPGGEANEFIEAWQDTVSRIACEAGL